MPSRTDTPRKAGVELRVVVMVWPGRNVGTPQCSLAECRSTRSTSPAIRRVKSEVNTKCGFNMQRPHHAYQAIRMVFAKKCELCQKRVMKPLLWAATSPFHKAGQKGTNSSTMYLKPLFHKTFTYTYMCAYISWYSHTEDLFLCRCCGQRSLKHLVKRGLALWWLL